MVSPMTAVPLAMQESIPGLSDANWPTSGCVMLRIVGMFSTGLITAHFNLVAHIGINATMASGLLVQAISCVLNLYKQDIWTFYLALYLLGVGWNLSFVSGTMLLLRSHSEEERPKVSATNESLRFAANAIAALLSSSASWRVLNIVCLVTVSVVAAVMLCAQERTPVTRPSVTNEESHREERS